MKRNYTFANLVMLQTCQVIVTNVLAHAALFTKRRVNITQTYLEALALRILNAIKLVSADKLIPQKNITRSLKQIIADGVDQMRNIYYDLNSCFAKDKTRLKEILQMLGFTTYYAKASAGNQEYLTALLFAFKENIAALRDELIAHSMNAEFIDALMAVGEEMNSLNVQQEVEKKAKIKLTENQQQELNDIFTEVTAMCKLGKSIFMKDHALQQLFVFSSIAEGFSGDRPDNPDKGDPASPAS